MGALGLLICLVFVNTAGPAQAQATAAEVRREEALRVFNRETGAEPNPRRELLYMALDARDACDPSGTPLRFIHEWTASISLDYQDARFSVTSLELYAHRNNWEGLLGRLRPLARFRRDMPPRACTDFVVTLNWADHQIYHELTDILAAEGLALRKVGRSTNLLLLQVVPAE